MTMLITDAQHFLHGPSPNDPITSQIIVRMTPRRESAFHGHGRCPLSSFLVRHKIQSEEKGDHYDSCTAQNAAYPYSVVGTFRSDARIVG